MKEPEKEFIIKNGVRFEVTPHGLFCCPEEQEVKKKHNCHDCKFCQWCSPSRCSLCLRQREGLQE